MVNPTRSATEMKLEAARLRRERDLQDEADARQEREELSAKLRELKNRKEGKPQQEGRKRQTDGSGSAANASSEISPHKYEIGSRVFLSSRDPRLRGREFEIVGLMPSDGNAYQYRIKAVGEPNMRLAKEHELTLRKL